MYVLSPSVYAISLFSFSIQLIACTLSTTIALLTVMPEPTLQPQGGLAANLVAQLEQTAESMTEDMHILQTELHKRPEIAWEEVFAHDTATAYMEKEGWKVTRHAYGLDTAWRATYEVGQGGPVVGYNSESKTPPDSDQSQAE